MGLGSDGTRNRCKPAITVAERLLLEKKRPDTVGELKSAEMCVPHMPSLQAQKLGKLFREKYS